MVFTQCSILSKQINFFDFLPATALPFICIVSRLFPEWILQDKAGHLMVFTQCSILYRDSPDVEGNRSPFVRQRTERIV